MRQPVPYLTVPEMLDQAVTDCRNRGHKVALAIDLVAEFFGITPRRVKEHIYYGEDRCADRDRIFQRYMDHLAVEQQQITLKMIAVRARIEEVSKSQ